METTPINITKCKESEKSITPEFYIRTAQNNADPSTWKTYYVGSSEAYTLTESNFGTPLKICATTE